MNRSRLSKAISQSAKRRHRRAASAALHLVVGPTKAGEFEPSERNVDCSHYAGCLDYALRVGWDNFDCEPCEDYDPTDEIVLAAAEITRSVIAQRREELTTKRR